MGRAKVKRKSTAIDMTAMCDVAFLLLSFFILTAQFKPSAALPVTIPNSVASKAAKLTTDAFVVTVNPEGKVFIELSDEVIRGKVLNNMEGIRGKRLSASEENEFKQASYIGTPWESMPEFLGLTPEELKKTTLPGIPVDSTGGDLRDWISAGLQAYGSDLESIHFIIKGDDNSKYPVFANVLNAFKKNNVYRFQLLTSPETPPPGSELYKDQSKGIKQED